MIGFESEKVLCTAMSTYMYFADSLGDEGERDLGSPAPALWMSRRGWENPFASWRGWGGGHASQVKSPKKLCVIGSKTVDLEEDNWQWLSCFENLLNQTRSFSLLDSNATLEVLNIHSNHLFSDMWRAVHCTRVVCATFIRPLRVQTPPTTKMRWKLSKE